MSIECLNVWCETSWHDSYLKWICGFANARGGRLYIGKNDAGEVVGVPCCEDLAEEIPNKIREHLGIVCDVNVLEYNGLHYLEIIVFPYTVPISLRGRYYFRSGSVKMELTGVALNEFLLKRTGKTWDDVVEERATIEDIDSQAIKRFLQLASRGERLPNVEGLSDWQVLERLRLVEDQHLKRAAIILFGKNPNKFYPNIQIKIGRFKSDELFVFQEVIEGNLFKMFEDALDILEYKFIVRRVEIKGMLRVQKPGNYPREALREILLNALVHRNYMGSMVQMRVYDDKITVWNIGTLPEMLTIADLKRFHSSFPRNPLIADVCFKANLIDLWGSGIQKMMQACANAHVAEPEIEEFQGGILVTLREGVVQNDIEYKVKTSHSTFPSDTPPIDKNNTPLFDAKYSSVNIRNPFVHYSVTSTFNTTPPILNICTPLNESCISFSTSVSEDSETAKKNVTHSSSKSSSKAKVSEGREMSLADKILQLIAENPFISRSSIANALQIGLDTVKEYMGKLKSSKRIVRVGPNKGGYWRILK